MIIGIRVVGGILIQCLQSLKSNIDKVSAIILEMTVSLEMSVIIFLNYIILKLLLLLILIEDGVK